MAMKFRAKSVMNAIIHRGRPHPDDLQPHFAYHLDNRRQIRLIQIRRYLFFASRRISFDVMQATVEQQDIRLDAAMPLHRSQKSQHMRRVTPVVIMHRV